MKTLLILILLVSTRIYAQNVVEHVPPDFKYDTITKKFIPFEPKFEYDCHLDFAEELLYLWKEYEKWCYIDSTYSCQEEFIVENTWGGYSVGHSEYICKWRHRQPGSLFGRDFICWIENVFTKKYEQ